MTTGKISKKLVISDYPYVMDVRDVVIKRYAPYKFVSAYIGCTRRIILVENEKERWYEVKSNIWKTETKTLTWDVFDPDLVRQCLRGGERVRFLIGKGKRGKRDYVRIDPHSNCIEERYVKAITDEKDLKFKEICD